MRNSLLRPGAARRKDRSASAASSNASTWGQTKISWDIHQCPLAKRCRARWEKLEPVQGDTAIRFCAACERSVYLCQTDEDLAASQLVRRARLSLRSR